MNGKVGVWIDHRQAVIVNLKDGSEHTLRILSHMDKHVRFSRSKQDPAGEDQRDRRFTGHLDKYYDTVVSRIRDADAILILGPGEAKGELKARLENQSLGGLIAGCDPADKMTDGQLAAMVRKHFALPAVSPERAAVAGSAHVAFTHEG